MPSKKKRPLAYRATKKELASKIYDKDKMKRTNDDVKWREALKQEIDNLEDFVLFGWSSRHNGIYVAANDKELPEDVTPALLMGSVPFAFLLKSGLPKVLPHLFDEDEDIKKNIEKLFDIWAELLVNEQIVYAEKIYDAVSRAVDDKEKWDKVWDKKWRDAIQRAQLKMVAEQTDKQGHDVSVLAGGGINNDADRLRHFNKMKKAATKKEDRLSWFNFKKKNKKGNK